MTDSDPRPEPEPETPPGFVRIPGRQPDAAEVARAHRRRVLRLAVNVAIARQDQRNAAQALHLDIGNRLTSLPEDPEAYPVTLPPFGLDLGPMIRATATLDDAVDQLTDALVDATIASIAREN